jgi:predicted ArsR family transcriptional regulator
VKQKETAPVSQEVQDRREQLWEYLSNYPEGLTREELALQSGVKSATVKTDLQALSKVGRAQVSQGGSTGKHGSYRRAWVATVPGSEGTPLYDALLLTIESGASVSLTAELLRQLRKDLTGV